MYGTSFESLDLRLLALMINDNLKFHLLFLSVEFMIKVTSNVFSFCSLTSATVAGIIPAEDGT